MINLTRFLLLGLLAGAGAATASAKIERSVEKSFPAQPGVLVKVATEGGDIRVTAASDGLVRVVAKEHVNAHSDAEADILLQKLKLDIVQSGNEVDATAGYEKSIGFHRGSWPPVEVEFVVSVPPGASLELKTSGGDVEVGSVGGTVHARTSGGTIKLGVIDGPVDANTSGGNISLEMARADVRLTTSGGNITVGKLLGKAVLRTSGGDIKVDSTGGGLDAETSGGDVRAGFVGPFQESNLATSGGQVKAEISRDASFHLDASTSGGEVDASGLVLKLEHGGEGRSALTGDVNGGGPTLRLRSSGGDVTVVTR